MVRTAAYTIATAGANIYLVSSIRDPLHPVTDLIIAGIASIVLIALLIRHTSRRSSRRAMKALARGGETFDLILAEAERRRAQRDTPEAR